LQTLNSIYEYLITLKGMEDKTENGIKMVRESVSNFDAFVKSTTNQGESLRV